MIYSKLLVLLVTVSVLVASTAAHTASLAYSTLTLKHVLRQLIVMTQQLALHRSYQRRRLFVTRTIKGLMKREAGIRLFFDSLAKIAQYLIHLTHTHTAFFQPFPQNFLYFSQFFNCICLLLYCSLFLLDLFFVQPCMFKIFVLKKFIYPRSTLVPADIQTLISFLSTNHLHPLFLSLSSLSLFQPRFANLIVQTISPNNLPQTMLPALLMQNSSQMILFLRYL